MEAIRKSALTTTRAPNKRLRINVSGTIFDTWAYTLERKPGTRLARLAKMLEKDESFDAERGEYFFDKHPGVFATVMHYYRTEELHTDHNLCGTIIRGELEFWGLTELDIEPCCWGHYNRFKENKETLAALDDNFTFQFEVTAFGPKDTPYTQFKRRMWIFLEDPASSRSAKIYAVTSMFFVLLSIAVFCLETHHFFRKPLPGYNATVTPAPTCTTSLSVVNSCCCRMDYNDELPFNESEPHESVTYLDYLCAAFFTIEFLARFYFAPDKVCFMKVALNVIDILCLLPHFVSIVIKSVDPTERSSQIIKVVLALRIIRVLRIFKLMKHYTAFKILVYTIKVSMRELLLMVIFLFTGVLIFASVMFYAENVTFNNIPIGFWWALVTMTTVGYGDKVPRTEAGYVLGSLCVLCGVLTVAFTVPIVVNNFTLYYSHAQSRVRLPPPKREELQKKLILKNQKAQEFIQKLAFNVKKTKEFNSLNTPRPPRTNTTLENNNSTTPRNTRMDSRMDTRMNTRMATLIDSPSFTAASSPPKKDLQQTVSASTISTIISNDRLSVTTPGLPTVAASVAELSLELPGTPAGTMNPNATQEQQIETVQLLHCLEDQQEKTEMERRRQRELVNTRREERRHRISPRPSPAPAAAARPAPVTQSNSTPVKSPTTVTTITPMRPAADPPASTRPAHTGSMRSLGRRQ